MSGGPVDVSAAKASPHVSSILYIGYPGPFGGNATAETIFAQQAPAAKIITTVYPAVFTEQVSYFEMNLAPGPSVWPPFTSPGRTHMHYTGTPVYPFGWGLSYTQWRYELVTSPGLHDLANLNGAIGSYLAAHPNLGGLYSPLRGYPLLNYTVRVFNMGSMDSDEVVLGFFSPPGAGTHGIPLQVLFDFHRVHVSAGASVDVFFSLQARHLTQVVSDPENKSVRVPLSSGPARVFFGVSHEGVVATARVEHDLEFS